MATFGSTPGVQISSDSGTVSGGVTVGRSQYTILLGAGNNAEGSATPNTVVDVDSRSDAKKKFGSGTDITKAYEGVRNGGADPSYIKAIMAETTEQTESFTSTSTGTLTEEYVVPHKDRLTFTDVGNSTEFTIEYDWGDSVSAPSSTDIVRYNPKTTDWAVSASTEVDVSYESADYTGAVGELTNALREGEFGLVFPLTVNPSVRSLVDDELDEEQDGIRKQYKMGLGVYPLAPNANDTDDSPIVDAGTVSTSLDSDKAFVAGPMVTEGADPNSPLYGIENMAYFVGHLSGADIDNPVYNDTLIDADPIGQIVSSADVSALRDEHVIPLRDRGSVKIKDNQSTYDQAANGGWIRDYFRKRIVDLTVASVNETAEESIGGIQNDDTIDNLVEEISLLLESFVSDLGILEQGGQSLEVTQVDSETIGVDLGITPLGVTKTVNVELTVQP